MKRWKTAAYKHKNQFKQAQIKTSGNQAESSKSINKPQNQNKNLNSEMEIWISYKERNPIATSMKWEKEMPYGKRRGSNLQWICSVEQATTSPSLPLPLSLSLSTRQFQSWPTILGSGFFVFQLNSFKLFCWREDLLMTWKNLGANWEEEK